MKFYRVLPLFIAAVFLMQSCQKDVINTDERELIEQPIEFISTFSYGLITDPEGQALSQVKITLGENVAYSDERGYFRIEYDRSASSGAMLKFIKDGHFDNIKLFVPQSESQAFLRVQMVPLQELETLNAVTGGRIETPEGVVMEFPDEAFSTLNQAPYSGEVTVYGHWYDPQGDRLPERMPGDLRGADLDGERVQLATYGMMAVELKGENGEELQLTEGKVASIDFPLTGQLASSAPEIIDTWSLDEESGYWVQEGTAELVDGSIYRAEVNHFSFWNCDIPYRPISLLKGTLVNEQGQSLTNYKVCVTMVETSLSAAAWTNDFGYFSGYVPGETPLLLQVKNECGDVIHTMEFTAEGNEYDLGIIEVSDLPGGLNVSGSLTCDGAIILCLYCTQAFDNY